MAEAVHIGKRPQRRYHAAMLRVVTEPRRLRSAVRKLRGSLKGVPARGVRITWRGGELRTTLHWARDDRFWWAFEPRRGREALLLGHAADGPRRRESLTCEINLALAGADRRLAGIVAADEAGALYLAHSGRIASARRGPSKAGFREFLADGVWRTLAWPDGVEREALIVAPLDSPRLSRLLGQFVDAVRRFKAGDAPAAAAGLYVEPVPLDPARTACDRRLVDRALHEELAKRGLFGGPPDLFTLRGERPQPLFALISDGHAEALALAVGSLSLASARGGREVRPILIAPAALAAREVTALQALPFACVRFRWRGARAVFDGLDDALE
jgi:hypothetical protein